MKGKGYFIGERAGLLDHKHIKAMGPARWLFSWAIRRQTGTARDGWGVVLYGNTITYGVIEADLGAPIRTLQRWMDRLTNHGYLRVKRGSRGFKLFVAKPKKSPSKSTGFPQSDPPKVADHDPPKVADHRAKSGGSHMADHTNKSQESNKIEKKVADHRSIKDLEVKDFRRKRMLSPSAPVYPPGILKQIPKPKTEAEIDQRRRFLLRQRDQILSGSGRGMVQ